MKTSAKKFVILKIGGSVITYKSRKNVFLRRKVIATIAQELQDIVSKRRDIQVMLIHGAGAGGHQLAKEYRLTESFSKDSHWRGAFLSRKVNQKLDLELLGIFLQAGLRITPVHTASIIVQTNGTIASCAYDAIDQAVKYDCIPLLYGEIVFDTNQGMSICSGDTIAVLLAEKYNAESILYASDVDGIFNKDPHLHKDAAIIRSVKLRDILANTSIALSGSHTVDVTGGLHNKIDTIFRHGIPKSLRTVAIFNGLKPGSLKQALEGKSDGTVIEI